MQQRTSRRNFEFKPIHTKEKNIILEFTRRCIRLLDDTQPIRATDTEIAELSAARDELQKCNNPIMHYGAQAVYKEGDMPTHLDLLLELNNLIIELKLRNLEHETREITTDEIERIRELTFKLDGCRKRVVFY